VWRRAIGHAFRRRVTEVAPSVDHLLGRAAADAELQASASDNVGGTGVLCHIQRILVAHINDRRADLNPIGFRADGSQQREGGAELTGEVMHPEIGAVQAELLGRDGQVD
jgi:hypothetical protein